MPTREPPTPEQSTGSESPLATCSQASTLPLDAVLAKLADVTRTRRSCLALPGLLCPLLLGCRSTSPLDEPFVDRGDGALPAVRAPKLATGGIQIDGRLDEPAWKRAGSTGPFVSPGTGHPAPKSRVNAVAHLTWDDAHLFVGFEVHDPDPSTPFARDDVDPHLWARASGIELMLQPGDPGDNRDYFEVQVDVGGAVWDTRFDDYNRPISGGPSDDARRFGHQDWKSGIERATRRNNGSYVVELSLPWAAFRTQRWSGPPRKGDVWRANFYSFRDGQADALAWSPILGRGNFHRAERFGRLVLAD